MRALIVVRLSRVTEATTSPERQRQECESLCEQRGFEIVGLAEDLDVSGAVDPFKKKDRPNLARWLAGEEQAFDVIVVYRVDRLTRSIKHLQKLVAWAEDEGKQIVSATEPHFDMTTTFAAVVIALMGTIAQMELEAISERNRSAARHNMKQGKYRGGSPPYGYVPTGEEGNWRLVQDPDQVKVIGEVVRRVLDGEPLRAIAHDLTRREVPTPRDSFDIHKGREPKGVEWRRETLKKFLTGQALLGYAMADGQPIRNDDGSPVMRAEPILTREVFERVGAELASRNRLGEPQQRSTSLLLRVLFCGVCSRPAYRLVSGHGRQPRYRCAGLQLAERCGNGTIIMAEIDGAVESMILGLLKGSYRMERVWDVGSDHGSELAEIDDTLADLTDQLGTGVFARGTPQRERLDSRIAALAARQKVLSEVTVKPAGWEWTPTDELFSDWWAEQDVKARNIWLRSMGIRVEFDCHQWRIDFGDMQTLTSETTDGPNVAAWKDHLAGLREVGLRGMETWPPERYTQTMVVHPVDGEPRVVDVLTDEGEAAAAEAYGWDTEEEP